MGAETRCHCGRHSAQRRSGQVGFLGILAAGIERFFRCWSAVHGSRCYSGVPLPFAFSASCIASGARSSSPGHVTAPSTTATCAKTPGREYRLPCRRRASTHQCGRSFHRRTPPTGCARAALAHEPPATVRHSHERWNLPRRLFLCAQIPVLKQFFAVQGGPFQDHGKSAARHCPAHNGQCANVNRCLVLGIDGVKVWRGVKNPTPIKSAAALDFGVRIADDSSIPNRHAHGITSSFRALPRWRRHRRARHAW